MTVSLRTAQLRVGCSLVALLTATAAAADCSPNPTQAGTTTSCTGAETRGLVVGTSGATVAVAAGASVTAPAGRNAVAVAPTPAAGQYGSYATLTIGGRVDGGGANGIALMPGATPAGSYFPGSYVNITVAGGGVITGAAGVVATGDAASSPSTVTLTLDNSGTVDGTGGFAILATDPLRTRFTITNRDSGTLGAVFAPLTTLDNAGIIDGGASGAVTTPPATNYYGGTTIVNSGTIRAASPYTTIALQGTATYAQVNNSGTIVNTGSGAALTAASGLTVTNTAGATIATAGRDAVYTPGTLSLVNRGAITGNVYSGGPYASVDTSGGGTIAGNILLGNGGNTLTADFGTAAAPVKGISGTIDPGSGRNTLSLQVASDTTVAAPLASVAGFATVGFGVAAGATLTLAPGFTTPTTLNLGNQSYATGSGAVVIDTTLASTGPTIIASYYGSPSIINNGTISATLTTSDNVAVSAGALGLVNTGTIAATGGSAVNLLAAYGGSSNSGTITATGTALSAFSSPFTNSGTITSTDGVGVAVSGSSGESLTNSGTISGRTAGAETSILLINSGTITSPTIGVLVDWYGGLDNRTGGVVNGGVGAGTYGSSYDARITNAGTINGTVDLGSTGFYFGSGNTVIAASGGIINGDLVLGSGNDTFVTRLTNTGPGVFAGVTGTVSGGSNAGGERIRYLVDASASAVVGLTGGFTRLGYELSNGAALTLTAPVAHALPLDLAGSGSVDLTADLSQNGATVLNLTAVSVLNSSYPLPTNALVVTSHGTLSGVHDTPYTGAPPVVAIGTGSSFTNAGTIAARDTLSAGLAAISGAGTVVNAGAILLDGADGIVATGYSGLTVTNSGSIRQIAGGGVSTGITGATTIVNSGSITTGGPAIHFTYIGSNPTLTNSGTIVSTGGAAIVSDSYGAATVTNAAGGSITGNGSAITLTGGTIDNSGTIIGNVDLGCGTGNGCYFSNPGVFVARAGGSVAGNVTFGNADDLFVAFGPTTGVSGTIDGGGGTNTFARTYATSITVAADALPTNFQRAGIGATGASTVVTVTGPAAGLTAAPFFFGDGAVINAANVNAAPASNYYYPPANTVTLGGPATVAGLGSTLAFTNQAMLADGITGTARSFTNGGTIGSPLATNRAVVLQAAGDHFDFANAGTIAARAGGTCYYSCQPP